MEWINIVNKLPDKDALYFVYIEMSDKSYVDTAWYDPSGFGWSLLPKRLIKVIKYYRLLSTSEFKVWLLRSEYGIGGEVG